MDSGKIHFATIKVECPGYFPQSRCDMDRAAPLRENITSSREGRKRRKKHLNSGYKTSKWVENITKRAKILTDKENEIPNTMNEFLLWKESWNPWHQAPICFLEAAIILGISMTHMKDMVLRNTSDSQISITRTAVSFKSMMAIQHFWIPINCHTLAHLPFFLVIPPLKKSGWPYILFEWIHSKTSHLLDTVSTLWLGSNCVVTVDNCRQHGD